MNENHITFIRTSRTTKNAISYGLAIQKRSSFDIVRIAFDKSDIAELLEFLEQEDLLPTKFQRMNRND